MVLVMHAQPDRHAAFESQRQRLEERKAGSPRYESVCGTEFLVLPGVYDTSVDTELMAESVVLMATDRFLEVGCGCGAVSLLLATRCVGGVATDINPLAVRNAETNAERLGVRGVEFVRGDGYAGIMEKFDVLLCNPPYSDNPVRDEIERMFWDPSDHLKRMFFEGARAHLLPGGRVYFGWADFADIDADLPLRLAEQNGFLLRRTHERRSHSGKYRFFVFEFA